LKNLGRDVKGEGRRKNEEGGGGITIWDQNVELQEAVFIFQEYVKVLRCPVRHRVWVW
jgi:hypothetical protein